MARTKRAHTSVDKFVWLCLAVLNELGRVQIAKSQRPHGVPQTYVMQDLFFVASQSHQFQGEIFSEKLLAQPFTEVFLNQGHMAVVIPLR
ncbi:hypothetical protein H2248_009779 [Termitomyces sp. 'cryptogamus']|nr:hypothetical protein H2248_009779 [Termitomyces sp. 'cryptogamus']